MPKSNKVGSQKRMLFTNLTGSVANLEMVIRCGAKVVEQLKDNYIMDEVTITEFEDPKVAENVAMVTICNVEYNVAKDHVSNA